MFYTFLWNDKRDKIKRKTVIGNKLSGGLDMIDIKSYIDSLKFKWIQNLCGKTNMSKWKYIPNFYFEPYGHNFLILHMNIANRKQLI